MKIFVWQNLMTVGMLILVLAGCGGKLVDINVTIVDQKTALENQILGSFEELSNEVLLLASVRSIDEEGKLKPVTEIPKGKLRALRAMHAAGAHRGGEVGAVGQGGTVDEEETLAHAVRVGT